MRSTTLFLIAAALLAEWTLAPHASGAGVVVYLHPSGTGSSHAMGLSSGQQAGEVDSHAGYWTGASTSWVNLHPSGATYSSAHGVASGKQVGEVDGRAALWSNSAGSRVDLHPAGAVVSSAWAISGAQQVGEADGHAGFWSGTSASWVDLHPGGASLSHAYGVYAGQQVGDVDGHAGLWSGAAASRVDLHPNGAAYSCAYGISSGQQVGEVDGHAALWTGAGTSRIDLNPSSATHSAAYAAASGLQAGEADGHAGFWRGTAGSWIDLHWYLPSNYSSSAAQGIEVYGGYVWIAGEAYNSSSSRSEAVLWRCATPDPGLTGHVNLKDYDPASSTPVAVGIDFIRNGVNVRSVACILDADGNYTVNNVTPDTYDIAFKASQFLRAIVRDVTLSGFGFVVCDDVSLDNGDCNGDNEVRSTDASIILMNMDMMGNW